MSQIYYEVLRAKNAADLSQCVQQVYGDSYPYAQFYDSRVIASAMQAGLLHVVVARNEHAEVVGSICLRLPELGAYTGDGIALMVDERYRKQGVLAGLGVNMVPVYHRLGILGLQINALALHPVVQRQTTEAGAVVTGVLPAYFPPQTKVNGYQPDGYSIAAVMLHLSLAPLPKRSVYLPPAYESIVVEVYQRLEGCGVARELLTQHSLPSIDQSVCQLESSRAERAQTLTLNRIGLDFEHCLPANINTGTPELDAEFNVQYLDVSLADPAVSWATDIAYEQGFIYGNLVVDRLGGDCLRLQRFRPEAMARQVDLASVEAESLWEYCREYAAL